MMSANLMDCSMATVATPAWQDTVLLVEDDERVRYALHKAPEDLATQIALMQLEQEDLEPLRGQKKWSGGVIPIVFSCLFFACEREE